MNTDEDIYHATPQTQGKTAHKGVDKKTSSNKKNEILSLPVFSDELQIMGKIDVFKKDEKILIERKYQLKQIFKGQIYQLWAQFFCMKEMGYEIEEIAFYEISTNKMHKIPLPGEKEKNELKEFIEKFKNFNPENQIVTNPNKCAHCIYCNLCDKTENENVYT